MDSLFSTKSSGELTRYPVGNTVNNQYKILSPLIPILGGNLYRVEDINSSENKKYLLMQLESNVSFQNYQDERPNLKLLSSDKKNDAQGAEFIIDITGYSFLGECVKKTTKEEEYKALFLPVMEWLEKYHQQHRKSFAFLHYHNVLLSDKNILVLGTSFSYNYFKCQINPYPHLVSPNYINSLRFPQGSKYNLWSDYYPIAIMIWEQFLKHPPVWDEHSMRFQEEVSAGMYTSFIQSFTDNSASYLNIENPLERFKNLKFSPPVPKPSPSAMPVYTPYSIASSPPLYEEKPAMQNMDSQKVRSLEQENTRLYEKLDDVYQQLETLKIEAKKKKKLFSLFFSSSATILLSLLLLLFFLGFRVLSPAQMQEHEKNKVQKNFWHTIGLLQSKRISEAKALCEELQKTQDHALVYVYLHVLQNIYELNQERNLEKKQEIKKNMMDRLLFLQSNKEKFFQEIEGYQLSISTEEIDRWLIIFKK
ncbi:MAG: hypothetical protein HUU50_19165 [Candidatus Brocadiae bacterium]|nr:hypothetical protein [Candidatus Brocadiia bacterium]